MQLTIRTALMGGYGPSWYGKRGTPVKGLRAVVTDTRQCESLGSTATGCESQPRCLRRQGQHRCMDRR